MLFDFNNDDINGDPNQTQIRRILRLVYNYGRTNKNYSCEYTSKTSYTLLGFLFIIAPIFIRSNLNVHAFMIGPLKSLSDFRDIQMFFILLPTLIT